ncbi:PREDICTED: flap endonuclease GEN isoform X2 [Polistes dominula]|nr:PREDICTED: flap endonuclease GEN isoform X2 [Polistes dominula]
MGIACVQGDGEAEAMCAYLNADGLVDGCISQDSDCFLYGAKIVYRNFCMSAQGNRAGTGGAVDEYRIDKIENILNLGRNKMIALALLCGCDYNEGINGVGKEAALKFFKTVSDSDILKRIKSWRTDRNFEKVEAELSNPNLCTSCGHTGKLQKHTKSGCVQCGTVIKCKDTYKEERALILNEIQIRKKALLIDDFPDQELLDEFLIRKDPVPSKLDIKWKQPQINKFIDFVDKYLTWEPQYAFEKIFPLVTRWQLRNLPNISSDMHFSVNNLFVPEKIKKVRNIKSVASYEIIWTDVTGIREKLKIYHDVSDKENNDDEFINNELVTIEPQDAVLKCYPDLVESFEMEKNKKKSQKKTANKRQRKITKDPNVNNVEEGKTKKPQKRTKKKFTECANNKKIDEFIIRNKPLSLEESFERMSITPKRSKQGCVSDTNANVGCSSLMYLNESIKRPPQMRRILELEKTNVKLNNTLDRMFLELSPEDFTSENEDADLNITGIIDGICNTYTFPWENKDKTISSITNDLETLNVSMQDENFIENMDNIKRNSTNDLETLNVSMQDENFIENMNNIKRNFIESNNSDDTSLKKDTVNDTHDEFDDIECYVPLHVRIQRRCKINTPRKSKNHTIRKSKYLNISRCSFGFDAIMNETDIENV